MVIILHLWVWFCAQNCTSRWGCTNAEYSGTVTSFVHLAVLCLMHPRVGFALLGVLPAHSCWDLVDQHPQLPFCSQFFPHLYFSLCSLLLEGWMIFGTSPRLCQTLRNPEASWCGLAYFIFFRANFLWHRCYLKLRSHSPVTLGSCCFWSVFLIQSVRNNLWVLLIKTEIQAMWLHALSRGRKKS